MQKAGWVLCTCRKRGSTERDSSALLGDSTQSSTGRFSTLDILSPVWQGQRRGPLLIGYQKIILREAWFSSAHHKERFHFYSRLWCLFI